MYYFVFSFCVKRHGVKVGPGYRDVGPWESETQDSLQSLFSYYIYLTII